MGALNYVLATDIVSAALDFYVRGKAISQSTVKKPFLRWLMDHKKTFPGGKQYVSTPVQIAYMGDQTSFIQGYTSDDTLTFSQAMNLLRAQYPWKELHMGLMLTWSELKQDGITVTDNQRTSEHARSDLTRLTGILENRLDDFVESRARGLNRMFFLDGSQDSKQIPGLASILTTTPGVGSTGGLSRVTYPLWQHRTAFDIPVSPQTQSLTKKLRSEVRQLKVYGGEPDAIFAGSLAIEAVEAELTEKGYYSMTGFANKGKNDVGVAQIHMLGVGDIMFDPFMDQIGLSKTIYMLDSRRVKYRPMDGEEQKTLAPPRPYNYAVFLRSITETGAFEASQLNALGYYTVA